MHFVREGGAAFVLVAITLWVQCGGMAILIRVARAYVAHAAKGLRPWTAAVMMVRFSGFIIVLHLLEILIWAGFYRWQVFPSWETGFYFSAASYSTVGYGDIVLPIFWRSLGPLEAVVGILMCGMSVSALFVIATQLVAAESKLTR